MERHLFGPDEPDIGSSYVGPATSPATRWPNKAFHPGRRVERERFIGAKPQPEWNRVEYAIPGYQVNEKTPWGNLHPHLPEFRPERRKRSGDS